MSATLYRRRCFHEALHPPPADEWSAICADPAWCYYEREEILHRRDEFGALHPSSGMGAAPRWVLESTPKKPTEQLKRLASALSGRFAYFGEGDWRYWDNKGNVHQDLAQEEFWQILWSFKHEGTTRIKARDALLVKLARETGLNMAPLREVDLDRCALSRGWRKVRVGATVGYEKEGNRLNFHLDTGTCMESSCRIIRDPVSLFDGCCGKKVYARGKLFRTDAKKRGTKRLLSP